MNSIEYLAKIQVYLFRISHVLSVILILRRDYFLILSQHQLSAISYDLWVEQFTTIIDIQVHLILNSLMRVSEQFLKF